MADIVIRPPQPSDVEELLADLRPQDAAELDAALGPGRHRDAIEGSMRQSALLWTATADGRVGLIFGAVPARGSLLGGEAHPWALGTTLCDRHRRALIRDSAPYIARMQAAFPVLWNFVDARNTRAVAWLRRMGFTVHEPAIPHGAAGLPFHLFSMGS